MNSVDNKTGAMPFPNGGGPTDSDLMRATFFTGAPGGQGGGPATGGSMLSMDAILQALRRRWPSAIGAGTIAAALGVALVIMLFQARYVTSAAVQLVTKAPPKVFVQGGGEEDVNIFKGTMAARVKSPAILGAALKDRDPTSGRDFSFTIKSLEAALKTDFLLGPETMRITLTGDDPQEIATLVNRIVDAFIEESRLEAEKNWRTTIDTLEAIKTKAENEYRNKKNQLIKEEHNRGLLGDKDLDRQFNEALIELNARKADAFKAAWDVFDFEEEYKLVLQKEKDLPNTPLPPKFIDEILEKTPAGQDLLEQKREEEKRLDRMKIKDYSNYNKIELKLRELRKSSGIEAKLKAEALQLLQFDKKKALEKVNSAKRKKELMDEEVRKADKKAGDLHPDRRRIPPQILELRDEVLRLELNLAELSKNLSQLLIEPKPGGRVKEWSRAEVPSAKDYSRQIKFGAAGGLGFFLLGLFGIAFLELRAGRISVPNEVLQGLNMTVVGTLPPVPAKARNLSDAKDSSLIQSKLMEAVDSIRSYLIHCARTDNVHIVMITSAGVGEGKTSLASQLAASLARAWRKTLLIDGDLRHPATHTLFKLPLEPGFAEILRDEATPEECIKPTSLSRLWLMPAGHCDAHAVQALAQDNVRTMFETLRQQYEFIIVDSCPVLPVADSLSLGQHVDGVLYAVLRDVSRIPALKAAQMRLANLSIRSLGAVLIGSNADTGNSGSRYAMLEGSLK